MSLYTRLIGGTEGDIPFEQYVATCQEQRRGNLTRAEVIDCWNLDSGEQGDHDDVIARLNAVLLPLTADEMRECGHIWENGFAYTTEEALKTRWGIS